MPKAKKIQEHVNLCKVRSTLQSTFTGKLYHANHDHNGYMGKGRAFSNQ